LVTMYHLYTVDIMCSGLPAVDFNTLEYDQEDEHGHRKLKYIHAWVWMEWNQIQRYLFEGSTLKARKGKGAYPNPGALSEWLDHFYLDLSVWGTGILKSVENLWEELEKEECHLELWGKEDGVALLMRVSHVLQCKLTSTDERLVGKFLYHAWTQKGNGTTKAVNRLMCKKMSTSDLRFNEARFTDEAKGVIRSQLEYLVDAHYKIVPGRGIELNSVEHSAVSVKRVGFVDHRVDVEDSPNFKGLSTLYHLYTCDVECDGLPLGNFTSLTLDREEECRDSLGGSMPVSNLVFGRTATMVSEYATPKLAYGWVWVTWPQCVDVLHSRCLELDAQLNYKEENLAKQGKLVETNQEHLANLSVVVRELSKITRLPKAQMVKVENLLGKVREGHSELQFVMEDMQSSKDNLGSMSRKLPPSMVSQVREASMMARPSEKETSIADTEGQLPSTVSPRMDAIKEGSAFDASSLTGKRLPPAPAPTLLSRFDEFCCVFHGDPHSVEAPEMMTDQIV